MCDFRFFGLMLAPFYTLRCLSKASQLHLELAVDCGRVTGHREGVLKS